MGRQKLLMELDGIRILERVLLEVAGCKCFEELILVYSDEEILKMAAGYGFNAVKNEHPEEGLSSSIKLGIEAASKDAGAYMFFMGDQPFINHDIIKRILEEYKSSGRSIIVPVYNGNNGMPTVFSSAWKHELLELTGDTGGRVIIKKFPQEVCFIELMDELAGMDIDTEAAYQKALGALEALNSK